MQCKTIIAKKKFIKKTQNRDMHLRFRAHEKTQERGIHIENKNKYIPGIIKIQDQK